MAVQALIPIITTAISALSAANKAKQAKEAEKAAENLAVPVYKPNKSIIDYYDESYRRYNTSPTDTAEYKMYNQQVKQGTTQALSSLNKLRSGNVAGVVYNQNNALLKGAVAAEQQKAQRFGVLGRATSMKAGEEGKEFQQNQIAPFEKTYNLLTAKAGGFRQAENAAIQNAYNNAGAALSGAYGDVEGFNFGSKKTPYSNRSLTSTNFNNIFSKKVKGTNIPVSYNDKSWYQAAPYSNRSLLNAYT